MLTIRWNEVTGVSTTMEAERVSLQPQVDPDNVDRGRRHVFVDRPGVGTLCIDNGSVYVMNEAGKTISTYTDLEGSPPPI